MTNFFTKLFQGYHGQNAEVTNDVFEPKFENLNFFLRGLGQLDNVSAETMIKEITEDEVKLAIEKSKGNKSPGLDGITYEFYKKSKDSLIPIMTEIFNEQLGRLKLAESNKVGVTRLLSKVSPTSVPLVTELRPITLLNCDYKLLSMIIASRLNSVLPQLIKSNQSCGINNICSSVFNILSLVNNIELRGGKAAIMSLDLFKAYDRVSLLYLQQVLRSMKLDQVFIDWILLLHDGAKTRLLMDFLTDPISITFSVR